MARSEVGGAYPGEGSRGRHRLRPQPKPTAEMGDPPPLTGRHRCRGHHPEQEERSQEEASGRAIEELQYTPTVRRRSPHPPSQPPPQLVLYEEKEKDPHTGTRRCRGRAKEFGVYDTIAHHGKATNLEDLHTEKPFKFVSSM